MPRVEAREATKAINVSLSTGACSGAAMASRMAFRSKVRWRRPLVGCGKLARRLGFLQSAQAQQPRKCKSPGHQDTPMFRSNE